MTIDRENAVTHINGLPFHPTRTYLVALPRNLLAGFCEIEPLVHVCVCVCGFGCVSERELWGGAGEERERERERERESI